MRKMEGFQQILLRGSSEWQSHTVLSTLRLSPGSQGLPTLEPCFLPSWWELGLWKSVPPCFLAPLSSLFPSQRSATGRLMF